MSFPSDADSGTAPQNSHRSPHLVSAPVRRSPVPNRSGFDFTAHMRLLCADMIRRLPELNHIDLDQVAIGFRQTRKAVSWGLYASLTPLRFEGGRRTQRERGKTWAIQRVLGPGGAEMLYVLSFYLPRFMELPLDEKLVTVLHELWHISPRFDGDLRRHPGRCYAHTHSQAQYDAAMAVLARRWLKQNPPAHLYRCLEGNFAALQSACGRVYGTKIPAPKLFQVPSTSKRKKQ